MESEEEKGKKEVNKRIQYAVLGREGLQLRLGPNKRGLEMVGVDDVDERFDDVQLMQGVKTFEYCEVDGSRLALLTAEGVLVLDTDSGAKVASINRPGVVRAYLSPKGSFLLTCERWQPGNQEGNLIVWRVSDQQRVFQVTEKNLRESTWPLVKWTQDEAIAAHMVTNNVHMYDGHKFDRFTKVRYIWRLVAMTKSLFLKTYRHYH